MGPRQKQQGPRPQSRGRVRKSRGRTHKAGAGSEKAGTAPTKQGPGQKTLPGPGEQQPYKSKKQKSVYIVIQICIVFPDDRLVILVKGKGEL